MVRRSLLDAHHPSGDVNDPDFVVPLCKNCHAIESARELDAGIDLRHRTRTVLELAAGAARSRAVFHRGLADAEERNADELATLEERLDRRYPKWRDLPEAHR